MPIMLSLIHVFKPLPPLSLLPSARRVQRKQKKLFTQFKPLKTFEQGETMTKDEALKLALEALEADELDMVDDGSGNMVFRKEQAITAIKEALAQPEQELVAWEQFYPDIGKPQIAFNAEVIGYVAPQQGPVAWGVFEGNLHDMFFTEAEAVEMAQLKGNHAEVRPLYTHPLQRTWVALTAKEKHEFRYSHMTTADFIEVIEAKLKDKNTSEQE